MRDQELLRDYAERQSEQAFAELVRRHIDFVYSAALRIVHDPHTAEDVTQSTFIALTKNALQVRDRSVLSSWLHSTARNLAANAIRTEVRRRAREQEAAAMNQLLANEPETAWKNIAPHLDDAIAELGDSDRDALLLRYFERKSAREMGQMFGTSEEAAQKRVSRAVERLREFFAKRGIAIGASGLVILVSANAVQSAPVALAATISTAATLAGTAIHTSTAITTTKVIAMTTFQKTLVAATLAVVAGIGAYQTHQTSRLHAEVRTLQQQQMPLTERINLLQQERDKATNRLASLTEENGRLNSNAAELLQLRSEVARMRNQLHELAQTRPTDTENENELDTEAKRLATKAQLLKQLFTKMPAKSIPELQYLGAQPWLNRAELADLDTDAGIAKVLSQLRYDAKNFFAAVGMIPALSGYAEANGGQLPTDISQLKPYFANVGAGDEVLQRYQIVKTGTVNNLQPRDVLITEKSPVDEQNDTLFQFGFGTWSWHGTGANTNQNGSGGWWQGPSGDR